MIVASLVHVISSPDLSPSIVLQNLSSTSYKVQVFLVLGLLFSSIGHPEEAGQRGEGVQLGHGQHVHSGAQRSSLP